MKHLKIYMGERERKKILFNQVKKNKSIIYGAQSIMKQLPFYLRRKTEDYDIYSKSPMKSARQLEKKLDKQIGFDYYYVKKAMHKGTVKVMHRGHDLKDSRDDSNIADFSSMPRPKPKTIVINKVSYSRLRQESRNKKASLKDKQYKFRWKKDSEDLKRMKLRKIYKKEPITKRI